MAKRRRTNAKKTQRKKTKLTLQIKTSVLKEIWAVFYLGLGIFTILSLQKNFGRAGEIWISMVQPVVGWGIYALPVFLIFIALFFFFSRSVNFALSKILGAFLLLISGLSIVHLAVPPDKIYTLAQQGQYGGYIGFMVNFMLLEVLRIGSLGATAVLLVIFTIGFLLTFEISLGRVIAYLKPDLKIIRVNDEQKKGKRTRKEEEEEDEIDEEEFAEELARKIEDLPDSDFGMPQDEEEGTIQIKRATIAATPAALEEMKSATRKIEIKDESRALTMSNDRIDDEKYIWAPPSFDLLSPPVPDIAQDDDVLSDNATKIKAKLDQFGIKVAMHEVHVGPTVVQYTLKPHEGVKLSKITGLKNDLALALAATAVRIEAPIPGKSLVGIEVPNDHRSVVHLREIMESTDFVGIKSNLRLPLGRDVAGKPMCGDLASMPHLLMAGTTGSGKSVGMNSFLMSLVYQNSPADLRFIMIDPKQVELNTYNGIPHLLTPVITDPAKAAIALRWAVAEMNRRYKLLADFKVRNIGEYNAFCDEEQQEAAEKGFSESSMEKPIEGEDNFLESLDENSFEEDKKAELPQRMPNIVIVIDELADLMMAAGKEVEASICRVAQMARAVGMHLIVATQRPSVDVITGLIKANIPARIAFAVNSSIDSRTILDGIGAEDLLGKGDMLYLPSGMGKPVRIQGIYVSGKEIERVVNNIKLNGPPAYLEDILSLRVASERVVGLPDSIMGADDSDDLYEQALRVVVESRKASASLLQRRLKVGYARAARLLDLMEENGVSGPVNGAKAREIYMEN